jgi:phosphoglucomutase
MMENFRANPLKEMAGEKVVCYKDFKAMKQTDVNGVVTDIDMPEPSNVLQYFTESGNKVSVRPSGTEPKIKFYMEAKGVMKCREDIDAAIAAADALIEQMKEAMGI